MPRLKKSKPQNEPNPSEPGTTNPANPNGAGLDLEASAIDLNIEDHTTDPAPDDEPGLLSKLRRAAEKSGLFDEEEPGRIETRGRKKKTAAQDEFNTLTIAILSLALSLTPMPETVKPNDLELSQFSHHLTGLLIRHLPISGKFSADALDIIGLIAVLSGWYARVSPEIKSLKPKPQTATPPPTGEYYFNEADLKAAPLPDAISRINPNVGGWLAQRATTAPGV